MEITANITGIEYEPKFCSILKSINFEEFDINNAPGACLVKDNDKVFALSKWVSPKRSRSYPYERVYNTLQYPKKITVIPVIKDEGCDGDRDFIQWDTISLMSLLDVYIIFTYYNKAEKNKRYENKFNHQQFDNGLVIEKIKEIENYYSSALHWNLKEIKEIFVNLVDKSWQSYTNLSKKLKVKLHGEKGINELKESISQNVDFFIQKSREKAQKAQLREYRTLQPKEHLITATKSIITITNYLGGYYYLTVDEISVDDDKIFLCEAKHSRNNLLPSLSDIKDGLIKMILYTNLSYLSVNGSEFRNYPMLSLTSSKLQGKLFSNTREEEILNYLNRNKFNEKQKILINKLFDEAKTNNFVVLLGENID